MSDSISAFLLVRLSEDEARASAALPRWHDDQMEWEDLGDEVYSHARRHDPARALRDVEAKRAIVTRCELVLAAFADPAAGSWPDVSRRERSHADATLCALAAIYSSHPDYRDEWAA